MTLQFGRLGLHLWHDYWRGLWTNWTLIEVAGEYAPYKDEVELQVAILGVHFMADWFYGQFPTPEQEQAS